MLSTNLIIDVLEKIEQKDINIEYFQEQVLIIDNEKSLYDQGIISIDTDIYNEIQETNDLIIDVQAAYQDRIAVGCRTDLFWRVVGIDSSSGNFTIEATKLSVVGYSSVGIGTTTVEYVDSSGGISTVSLSSTFGLEEKNLYGIKYYDEPYTRDIGNTFVTSFIGTISIGSSILTVMNPVGTGISNLFKLGQLIISSKESIFPTPVGVEIVGIGTTTANLTSLYPSTGIGSTSPVVNRLILDTFASASAKFPENDNSYVTFTVIDDPAGVATEGKLKYSLPFVSNPFSPQTIGILETENIGIGISIAYDNSGSPAGAQSWDPSYNGFVINGIQVTPPNIGAGKIYYTVGFTSTPSLLGNPVALGDSTTVASLTSLYTNLATCPTQDANLTSKLNLVSIKESQIQSDLGNINLKVNASNGLRIERNNFNLRIWGIRQSIGKENEEIDRYNALKTYIGLSTITNIL